MFNSNSNDGPDDADDRPLGDRDASPSERTSPANSTGPPSATPSALARGLPRGSAGKILAVLLAAALLLSAVAPAGAHDGHETDGDATAGNATATTFHVTQGEECYEITPVGSGERNVSTFYDYRSGPGTLYGSYGEGSRAIQQNGVSHLFVYDGSEGLSLVAVHDALNGSEGGAVSFRLSGLPESREWVVEDDGYENPDDRFDHDATASTVHWMWSDGRTDGGAIRGLGGDFDAITVDSRWGENSWAAEGRASPWPYATDDVVDWQLRSGTGEEFSLQKGEPITIRKGSCPTDGEDGADGANVTLAASSGSVTENESVTFEASSSADAVRYEWDFDADGETDETTTGATISHAYASAGTHDATVTVVGGDGTEASASATVEVTDGEDDSSTC